MTDLVLYRKYRPKNFEEVLGQDHIINVLKNAVKSGHLAHAYIFAGPHGTGKTTVARILAKAASCEDQSKSPCGKCDSCKDFMQNSSFDLVEMDAASSRGIDEIRSLRDAVGLVPLKSKYKTYIIDEVHMLTKEAFNALLKTLEEPPAHAIFILATTDISKVPDTIISRCQKFSFRKIPDTIIHKALLDIAKKEGIVLDKDAAGLLTLFADGAFRDSQSMLGQAIAINDKQITGEDIRLLFGAPQREMVENIINHVFQKNTGGAMETVREAVGAGIDPFVFLKFILRDLRNMFLLKINPKYEKSLSEMSDDREFSFLKSTQEKTNEKELERALIIFLEAFNARRLTYLPHLPLELAAAKASMST